MAAEFKAQGNKFQTEGKFDEAIEAYSKAIELDGSDHTFWSNRSAAYLAKGDADGAFISGHALRDNRLDLADERVPLGLILLSPFLTVLIHEACDLRRVPALKCLRGVVLTKDAYYALNLGDLGRGQSVHRVARSWRRSGCCRQTTC